MRLPVAMRVHLILAFAAVAEGYFLAASKEHFWAGNDERQSMYSSMMRPVEGDGEPVVKFAFNKPQEQIATHSNASRISFSRRQANNPKYPIIEACHLKIESVFGKRTPDWYLDWKLWVGLMMWFSMWAKWLNTGFDEIYWQFSLFAFGVNIVILHILQYASSIRMGMLIVCSILVVQALVQSYLMHLRDFRLEANAAPSEASSDDLDEFDCDTLYLDLGLPLEQIIVLFVAQIGVWWFYMTSILASFDFDRVNYLFWAWAYLVMQMTMIFCRGNDSALGNAFPVHDLHRIHKEANKVTFRLKPEGEEKDTEPFSISRASVATRGAMGFFCNCILREIMAYTIPLMLMGFSEPMDFVVYCVGVNFICTLDDMSERKYIMTPLPTQESPEAKTQGEAAS